MYARIRTYLIQHRTHAQTHTHIYICTYLLNYMYAYIHTLTRAPSLQRRFNMAPEGKRMLMSLIRTCRDRVNYLRESVYFASVEILWLSFSFSSNTYTQPLFLVYQCGPSLGERAFSAIAKVSSAVCLSSSFFALRSASIWRCNCSSLKMFMNKEES